MEIGNDFLMVDMPSALRGPQASQVKFTDSRTQWMMTVVSNPHPTPPALFVFFFPVKSLPVLRSQHYLVIEHL